MIDRNAKRLLLLVNQILDERKIDKNQMHLHCQKTNLKEFLRGIISLYNFNAQERSITLSLKEDESLKEEGNGIFTGRGGLVDDKVGVGVDLKAGEKGKISVDAYDPNDLRVKLKGQYEVAQDTYLIGHIKDINDSDERAAYVGLRHEF